MSSGESPGTDQGSRHLGHDAGAGDVSCQALATGDSSLLADVRLSCELYARNPAEPTRARFTR